MTLFRVRINYAISDALREWLYTQTGFIRQVEESDKHLIVEFELTGQEALALKSAFNDRLIEVL